MAVVAAYDNLIKAAYLNDNHVLDYTFENISEVVNSQTPTATGIAGRIKEWFTQAVITPLIGESAMPTDADITPAAEESRLERFFATFGGNYRPMEKTSLPSIRNTPWRSDVKQIRLGTQAVRNEGEVGVNQLFKTFLEVQKAEKPFGGITHVYFNFLKRDKDVSDIHIDRLSERNIECKLTAALEALESRHSNIAVITLPADGGLMNKEDCLDGVVHQTGKKVIRKTEVEQEFINIALNGGTLPIKDFYISKNIRSQAKLDDDKIRDLINATFKTLKLNTSNLSPANRQAVWFHFTKYELPNYLINQLKPETMNCSCKDGIDRGGVASVYFNLLTSFESGNRRMTMDEFNREIHAPPAMVKGRGMNHHLNLLWNAVDAYVEANYRGFMGDPDKRWLIEWRDLNCPKARCSELLKRNLVHIEHNNSNPAVAQVRALVQEYHEKKAVDANKLLEALIHTQNLSSSTPMNANQQKRWDAFDAKMRTSQWFQPICNLLKKIGIKMVDSEHELHSLITRNFKDAVSKGRNTQKEDESKSNASSMHH